MSRVYKGGRKTTNFRKGKRISSMEDIKVGDILISVSHRFKAENLCKVKKLNKRPLGFNAIYVDPHTLKRIGNEEWFTHDFELISENLSHEYFKALPIKTSRVTQKDNFMSKMPVRDNFNPSEDEMDIRRAIHVLMDKCDDQVILMYDLNHSVFLIPSILGDNQEPTEIDGLEVERPAGTIEYQVSDGYHGDQGIHKRSVSHDFYRLDDAITHFNEIAEKGWL